MSRTERLIEGLTALGLEVYYDCAGRRPVVCSHAQQVCDAVAEEFLDRTVGIEGMESWVVVCLNGPPKNYDQLTLSTRYYIFLVPVAGDQPILMRRVYSPLLVEGEPVIVKNFAYQPRQWTKSDDETVEYMRGQMAREDYVPETISPTIAQFIVVISDNCRR